MPSVRRSLQMILSLALAGAACSGSNDPGLSTTATVGPTTIPLTSTESAPPPSPSTGPSPTLSTDPDVRLPAGMPATADDPDDVALIAAGDVGPLMPPGASPVSTLTLATPQDPIDQIALTWLDEGPSQRRMGLIVWQRFDDHPTWRAVYAFTDPPSKGVFGIWVDTDDLTRDAVPDLLSFEDVGGSGACGTYRVVSSTEGDASAIFRRDTCDTEIAISGGDLRVREAVFRPDDAHCCPSAFRTSVLRWNGATWEEISSEVVPTGPDGR
jgi:hypothetical protein